MVCDGVERGLRAIAYDHAESSRGLINCLHKCA